MHDGVDSAHSRVPIMVLMILLQQNDRADDSVILLENGVSQQSAIYRRCVKAILRTGLAGQVRANPNPSKI